MTPTNSFLLLGFYTFVLNLVKTDKERVTTHGQTDPHTDRQTQADFIICPVLYAIAMGQVKNTWLHPLCTGTLLVCTCLV